MTSVTEIIRALGELFLGLVSLLGVLFVLRLLLLGMRIGRRRQLIVEELCNLTGDASVDTEAASMTQEVREALVRQFVAVNARAQHLLERAGIRESGITGSAVAPPQSQVVEASLRELASSIQAFAPERAGPAVQIVSETILRPAGTRIRGRLLWRSNPRSAGLGFEMVDLRGKNSPATFSLWTPIPGDQEENFASVDSHSLVPPATQILAIELLRQDLLRRLSLHSLRPRRQKRTGLVSRFVGLIYQASAFSYQAHAAELLGRALDALREAVQQLPDDYRPLEDMGDTHALLGAILRGSKAEQHLRKSLLSYDRAEAAARKLPSHKREPAVRSIHIGRAIAQFRSSNTEWISQAEASAMSLLWELTPKDSLTAETPLWDPASDKNELLQYNAACLLSLECGRSLESGHDAYAAEFASWARRLLAYAMAHDLSPDRNVCTTAATEQDFEVLRANYGLDVIHLTEAVHLARRTAQDWPAILNQPEKLRSVVERLIADDLATAKDPRLHGTQAKDS